MKILRRIYGSPKAIITALFLFGIPTFCVWYWGDGLGLLVSYGIYASPDPTTLHRTVLLAQILLTAVFFLLQFTAIAWSALSERFDPPFSQAVVSNLMLSREQFRMLYDNSPIPYFLIDTDGNIHNPNLATLRFFERTRDELLMSNLFTLASENGHAEGTMGILRTKMERGMPIHMVRVCFKTPQGKDRWASATIFSIEESSPLPFKHLVTLVEAQEDVDEDHATALHHSA